MKIDVRSFNLSAEEKLLVAAGGKLFEYCLATNETRDLAVGDFPRISYIPVDGGTIVAKNGGKLVPFVQTSSAGTTRAPDGVVDLQSQPPLCIHHFLYNIVPIF